MALTTEQFWMEYGKPKLYPRAINQLGSTIPITPIGEVSGYARYIDVFLNATLTVSLPSGATAQLSDYFPFNQFKTSNSVGGVTQQGFATYDHYLEMITRDEDGGDPAYVGEGGAAGNDVSDSIWSLSNSPGSTIGSSSSTSAQTVTVTSKFWYRFYFQQNPVDKNTLYGCMPLGSPTFRPEFHLNIADNLVSNNQFLSTVVNTTPANAVTATLTDVSGTAVWSALNVPVLPVDVNNKPNPVIPANMVPTIGMARFTTDLSPEAINLGSSNPFYHRVAMIYHKIFHNVVVSSAANTTNVTNFRLATNAANDGIIWEYDDPNLASYQVLNLRRYGRYLPSGVLLADFQSGHLPKSQEGSEFMTPSQQLAQAFNLPLTPTMQTSITLSTAASPASGTIDYLDMGAVGLQPVTY